MPEERLSREELLRRQQSVPANMTCWKHRTKDILVMISGRYIQEATGRAGVLYCHWDDPILSWGRDLAVFLEKYEQVKPPDA